MSDLLISVHQISLSPPCFYSFRFNLFNLHNMSSLFVKLILPFQLSMKLLEFGERMTVQAILI